MENRIFEKLTAGDEVQERGWSISLNLEADTLDIIGLGANDFLFYE